MATTGYQTSLGFVREAGFDGTPHRERSRSDPPSLFPNVSHSREAAPRRSPRPAHSNRLAARRSFIVRSQLLRPFFRGVPLRRWRHYGSIGQDFYAAGRAEGNQIVKNLPEGGKVAIVTCCAGNVPLGQRAQGAMDVLK